MSRRPTDRGPGDPSRCGLFAELPAPPRVQDRYAGRSVPLLRLLDLQRELDRLAGLNPGRCDDLPDLSPEAKAEARRQYGAQQRAYQQAARLVAAVILEALGLEEETGRE